MRRKSVRFISLITALMMAASLSACGNTSGGGENTEAVTAEVTEAATEEVTDFGG